MKHVRANQVRIGDTIIIRNHFDNRYYPYTVLGIKNISTVLWAGLEFETNNHSCAYKLYFAPGEIVSVEEG